MYVLIQEPSDPELQQAFAILDDTVGSGEFEESDAISILGTALEDPKAAKSFWQRLKQGSHVEEV